MLAYFAVKAQVQFLVCLYSWLCLGSLFNIVTIFSLSDCTVHHLKTNPNPHAEDAAADAGGLEQIDTKF